MNDESVYFLAFATMWVASLVVGGAIHWLWSNWSRVRGTITFALRVFAFTGRAIREEWRRSK